MSNLDKPLKPLSFKLTKLSEIRENPNNPRTIKEDKFEKLVRSIQTFPEMLEARPIVVNPDMVVLGGNMRLKACKAAGLTEAPVYVASWEESKAKEFIVKDNVGFGEWDWDILANEWDAVELEEWGLDVWTPDEEPTEGLTDPDEVPSVPEEPKTKLGDLYILGEHRLLCGDSTKAEDVERLMNGERADMVFTDPPYGLGGYAGRSGKFDAIKNDNLQGLELKQFISCIPDAKHKFIWTTWSTYHTFIEALGVPDSLIVWVKPWPGMGRGYRGKHEFCMFYGECDRTDLYNVWENGYELEGVKSTFDRTAKCNLHPTQKPIALAEFAIANHNPNSLLDLFLGSGSTLIAAEKTGRKCYGMELDPKYCDVIVKRWEDFTGKKAELWKP